MRHKPLRIVGLLACPLMLIAIGTGCVKHTVEPIHITIDVNLRVDEELKDFFRFENRIEKQQLLEQNIPALKDQTISQEAK